MSTVKENRFFKVRELVEKSGGGTSFAARLGVEKQYVSQIAGKGMGRKGIGDVMARKIEREFGLPVGFLDQPTTQTVKQIEQYSVRVPMLEVAGSNANHTLATYKHDCVREITFFKPWMRQHVDAADHEKMFVATVRTDKMEPTFNRNDIVLIDASISKVDEAGVYVFEKGRILYINRMQPMMNGCKVLSDNPHYENEMMSFDEMNDITVYGRVAKFLCWGNC